MLLYNDDCLNILNQLNNIDHIICDLPYFKVVKNDFDNQWKTVEEYLKWFDTCEELLYNFLF